MKLLGFIWVISYISGLLSLHTVSSLIHSVSGGHPSFSGKAKAAVNHLPHTNRLSVKPLPAFTFGNFETLTHSSFSSLSRSLINPAGQPFRFLMRFPSAASSLRLGNSSTQLFGYQDDPQPENNIIQRSDSLSRWSKNIEQNLQTIVPDVVVVQANTQQTIPHSADQPSSQQSLAQCIRSRDKAASLTQSGFWIRVNGRVVISTPTRLEADLIAQRLRQLLRDPNFQASQLNPTLINGVPAGLAGNDLIFIVDDQIKEAIAHHPDIIATNWINNLRIALHENPLSLAESQAQLYGLEETSNRISGTASWYGPYFHGRITATGETFDENELTAAHPSLPFDTYLRVTNLKNGNAVIVRINDRGPYFGSRSLDLSRKAARCLDSEVVGIVPYEAVLLEPRTEDTTPLNEASQIADRRLIEPL